LRYATAKIPLKAAASCGVMQSNPIMNEPVCNNVYGYLRCKKSLEKVADYLRYRLNLAPTQVSVKKSQFDDTQTLRISTHAVDLETRKVEEPNLYLFNGSVSGSEQKYVNTLPLFTLF
jgi:hypothetical protein